MSSYWRGKKVVVTGGAGFIGSAVVRRLISTRGVSESDLSIPRSAEYDLRVLEQAQRAVAGADVVLHLAADVGGLGYSSSHPASQFYNCAQLDLNVVEATHREGVGKLVGVSSSAAYPHAATSPLREEALFDGEAAPSHLGYGMAKRYLVTLAEAYHCQYGLDACVVLATNGYGPRDHFDRVSSHVIPATILKCFEDEQLVVWGDGSPLRDFLYVDDFAEGVLAAAERLPAPGYVNIGSGREVSIRELVLLIARLTGYSGEVRFDASKPAGDPRRSVSIAKARELIDFEPRFALEEGLRETIEWYRSHILVSGSRA